MNQDQIWGNPITQPKTERRDSIGYSFDKHPNAMQDKIPSPNIYSPIHQHTQINNAYYTSNNKSAPFYSGQQVPPPHMSEVNTHHQQQQHQFQQQLHQHPMQPLQSIPQPQPQPQPQQQQQQQQPVHIQHPQHFPPQRFQGSQHPPNSWFMQNAPNYSSSESLVANPGYVPYKNNNNNNNINHHNQNHSTTASSNSNSNSNSTNNSYPSYPPEEFASDDTGTTNSNTASYYQPRSSVSNTSSPISEISSLASTSPSDNKQSEDPSKIRRSRMGCLTCRHRKKRCCETRPKCKECGRLGLNCTWPAPGSEHRNKSKVARMNDGYHYDEFYGNIKILRGVVESRINAN